MENLLIYCQGFNKLYARQEKSTIKREQEVENCLININLHAAKPFPNKKEHALMIN